MSPYDTSIEMHQLSSAEAYAPHVLHVMTELLTRKFLSSPPSSCCPKSFDPCRCTAVLFGPFGVFSLRISPGRLGIPDASSPFQRQPSCFPSEGWPNYGHGYSGNAWLHPENQKE